MATILPEFPETARPSEYDARLARESSRQLSRLLSANGELRVVVRSDVEPEQEIAIPAPAVRLLADMLNEMASGNTVTLMPVHAEFTTQQAADFLNVSRPFLISLLAEGKIPYRKVGTHRRILFCDVSAFKQQGDAQRLKMLEELTAQAQELDMGY